MTQRLDISCLFKYNYLSSDLSYHLLTYSLVKKDKQKERHRLTDRQTVSQSVSQSVRQINNSQSDRKIDELTNGQTKMPTDGQKNSWGDWIWTFLPTKCSYLTNVWICCLPLEGKQDLNCWIFADNFKNQSVPVFTAISIMDEKIRYKELVISLLLNHRQLLCWWIANARNVSFVLY